MSNRNSFIIPHARASIELLSKYKQSNSLTSVVHEKEITTFQSKLRENNRKYPAILSHPRDMVKNIETGTDIREYTRSHSPVDREYKYVLYKQGQKTEYLRKRDVLVSKTMFATQDRNASHTKNKVELLRDSMLKLETRRGSENWKEGKHNHRLVINYFEPSDRVRESTKLKKAQTKKFEIYCNSEQEQQRVKDLIFGMRISEDDQQKIIERLSTLHNNLSNSLTMLTMFKIISVKNKRKRRESLVDNMKTTLKENYKVIKNNLACNLKKALDIYRSAPKSKKSSDVKIIKSSANFNRQHDDTSKIQDLDNGIKCLSLIKDLKKDLIPFKKDSDQTKKKDKMMIVCTSFYKNNESRGRQNISINMKSYQIFSSSNTRDVLIDYNEISNISNVFKKASISNGYLTKSERGIVILGPRKQEKQKYQFKYLQSYYKYHEDMFEELDGNLNIKKDTKEKCRCIQIFCFQIKKSRQELEQIVMKGLDSKHKPIERKGLNPTDIEFKLEIKYNTAVNNQTLEMKVDKFRYVKDYYYVEVNQELYLSETDIQEYKEIVIAIKAFPKQCYNKNQEQTYQNAFKNYFEDLFFGRTSIKISDIDNIHTQNKFSIHQRYSLPRL